MKHDRYFPHGLARHDSPTAVNYGGFFKVNFLENLTSNEARTQLKTHFKDLISFFEPF